MTSLAIFVRVAEANDADVLNSHRELSKQEATQYRGSVMPASSTGSQGFTLVAGVGSTVMGSLVASPNSASTGRLTLCLWKQCAETSESEILWFWRVLQICSTGTLRGSNQVPCPVIGQ